MQTWDEAYRRLRTEKRFAAYFGRMGRIPGPNDFAYRAFVLVFQNLQGHSPDDVTDAPIYGPTQQIFDKGCVVLGITCAAYQPQQLSTVDRIAYPPSTGAGKRDLFTLFLQYTDNEKITSDQEIMGAGGAEINVLAQVLGEPLTGEGQKDIFPRELLVAPSTGINVSVQSMQPVDDGSDIPMPSPTVHVVFHVLVPRE